MRLFCDRLTQSGSSLQFNPSYQNLLDGMAVIDRIESCVLTPWEKKICDSFLRNCKVSLDDLSNARQEHNLPIMCLASFVRPLHTDWLQVSVDEQQLVFDCLREVHDNGYARYEASFSEYLWVCQAFVPDSTDSLCYCLKVCDSWRQRNSLRRVPCGIVDLHALAPCWIPNGRPSTHEVTDSPS